MPCNSTPSSARFSGCFIGGDPADVNDPRSSRRCLWRAFLKILNPSCCRESETQIKVAVHCIQELDILVHRNMRAIPLPPCKSLIDPCLWTLDRKNHIEELPASTAASRLWGQHDLKEIKVLIMTSGDTYFVDECFSRRITFQTLMMGIY